MVESARPLGFVTDHLDELHRRDGQRELVPEIETADIGLLHVDGQSLGRRTLASGAEELRIDVDCPYFMPEPRQVQRYPAGSAAEVEDRTARLRRQLLPGREVRGIAAALGVVPDDRGAHAQYARASPRRARSVRSSSSAV